MKPGITIKKIWSRLGPGILLAATSIGASHLVLAPQAGAGFGVTLLWIVPLVHLLKYPAFEFGPRYAAALGTSLLDGYKRAPGPKNWALWIFLLSTVLQGAAVLAGVVGITGAVLTSYVGLGLDAAAWGAIVVVLVIALLAYGSFPLLDGLNKTMMAVLALATVLAAIAQPPPNLSETLRSTVYISIPAGSIALVAAIFGWMPTGIDVSIWHSLWTLEKEKQVGAKQPGSAQKVQKSQILERLSLSLSDMRIGYVLSVVVAFVFVLLGAIHLEGQGASLRGEQFPSTLATIYGNVLGGWMFHLFFVAAFFAMFSTSYVVIDGFSRSFSEVVSLLRPNHKISKKRLYWIFALFSGLVATVTLSTVGNPVTLVLAVAIISLSFAPILYSLNTWCVAKHIKDPELRPSGFVFALSGLGIIFMIGASGLFVWVKLIK